MNDNALACPYCEHNLVELFNMLKSGRRDPQALAVLCSDCGEPLLYDDDESGDWSLRKPTDDELYELNEKTSLRQARAAWLVVRERQRRNEPPLIEQTWLIYRKYILRGEHDEDYVASHRKAYFAGAIAVAATIRTLGAEMNREDFSTYMDILHAELDSIDVDIRQGKPRG
jgi:hypothetical protein